MTIHRRPTDVQAGGPPALPGETPPHSAFPGPRASCPHQHTGGPSAHMRAGRPRSQGHPLRTAPFLGARASCPHQHTGGPSAHMRAGRPRSQEPLRSAPFPGSRASCPHQHTGGLRPTCGRAARAPRNPSARCLSWDRGHLARINTPVGLRPTCGRAARAPRNPSARCLSWDRGHLARINTPVGLRPTCGRDARAPRNPSAQRFPGIADILPASTRRWAFGPLAGGPPALPGTGPANRFRQRPGPRLRRAQTCGAMRAGRPCSREVSGARST